MAAEKLTQLADHIRAFEHSLNTHPDYAHIWVFSQNQTANELIWSSENAFFFGALSDQQIAAEKAWELPYLLRKRLSHLDAGLICQMSQKELGDVFSASPALHRLPYKVARYFIESSKRLIAQYQGDAKHIWNDNPTAGQLQARLCEFHGISQKISAMIIALLISRFQTPIRELENSQVAVDRHVRRVLYRSGACLSATLSETLSAGEILSPQNPGQIDFTLFWIGKLFCHPIHPDCGACPIKSACEKRLKPAVMAGLKTVRSVFRATEEAKKDQQRLFEKLSRQFERLSVRHTRQGTLHQMCAYHGKDCPHQGEKYHPIRYMLRTKEATFHVKKSDVMHIQKQLADGQKEGAALRAVVACQKVKQMVG